MKRPAILLPALALVLLLTHPPPALGGQPAVVTPATEDKTATPGAAASLGLEQPGPADAAVPAGPQGQEQDDRASGGPVDVTSDPFPAAAEPFQMPSSAYITVSVVGVVLLASMAVGAAVSYRRTVKRRRRQQLQEQQQHDEEAAQDKAAAVVRGVHIPPVILNPDSSVHLATVDCGDGRESGEQGTTASGDPSHSPTTASWHGQTVMVRGNESAFSRVSVWPAAAATPPGLDLEGGADLAATSALAADGKVAAGCGGSSQAAAAEGTCPGLEQQQQQQRLQQEQQVQPDEAEQRR